MNISLRAKLLIVLAVFAILPVGIVAALAFDTFHDSSRAATLDALEGIAQAKADAIDGFTDSRTKDVKRLAELLRDPVARLHHAMNAAKAPKETDPEAPEDRPPLQDAENVRPAPAGDAPAPGVDAPPPPAPSQSSTKAVEDAGADLRRTLGLVLGEQSTFEELLILGPDGVVLASTFRDHEGSTAAEIDYFRRGRAATFVQPVFLSPITEELTMVIATPIRGPEQEDLGVLAARLNLKRLFRLINDTTGLGKTGETVVGKKIDDAVIFMAPTRHDADAALERKVAGAGEDTPPLIVAARGNTGSGTAKDYRGENVLAAWTFAPILEWGVVVKIDAEEAAEPVNRIKLRLLIIALVVLAFIVPVSLLLAQKLIKPLRQLQTATQMISKGDFDVELDIRSRDEIGELADSFERMVAAIKFFRERSREGEDDAEDERPPTGE